MEEPFRDDTMLVMELVDWICEQKISATLAWATKQITEHSHPLSGKWPGWG